MRDPDKKRFINALNHIEQAEIPLFELEADMKIVSQMMGTGYDMSLHSFDLPAKDLVQWNRLMGNDMIYWSHIWRLGRKEFKDKDGRIHYIDGTMKMKESLKDIWYPDLDNLRHRLEELLDEIEGTGFGLMTGTTTAGFIVLTAVGYETFCLKTLTEPEFIKDFQKYIHEYSMCELEMYLEYPIDIFAMGSAFITNSGSMISPEMMEEYEYGYMQEQINLIKSRNLPVLLHADGDITELIPKFIKMGFSALHPFDTSNNAQDIYKIKKLYGKKMMLCGNIDINGVLLHGTSEEVKVDVIKHIDNLSEGGGYCVSSSHDLHQMIPVENIYAMRDAVHEHRFTRTAID